MERFGDVSRQKDNVRQLLNNERRLLRRAMREGEKEIAATHARSYNELRALLPGRGLNRGHNAREAWKATRRARYGQK